ncbi:protein phosphatase [Hathewaya limosa]|uniref:Protein phosphatase n=1 Tax=Hathewaya limosa TaxID=1536 RepID=A0ABU0JPI4_HATLI|nr:protein phosphatase [Hathewaya limosa]
MGIISDIGNYRKINEDSVGYFEDLNLRFYVVADGMGGHNAGEVASTLAVENVMNYFKQVDTKCDFKGALVNSIDKANKHVYTLSIEKDKYKGMGTTITVCLIYKNKAYIAHVGDSSCIIVKKNKTIEKITKDHSLVQELIDSGSITREEAINHPNKNIITRALGTSENINVDVYEFDVDDVYRILLCTDGLTNVVSLEEILEYTLSYTEEEVCKRLVELSKKNGSKDNISVIVFKGADENDR